MKARTKLGIGADGCILEGALSIDSFALGRKRAGAVQFRNCSCRVCHRGQEKSAISLVNVMIGLFLSRESMRCENLAVQIRKTAGVERVSRLGHHRRVVVVVVVVVVIVVVVVGGGERRLAGCRRK